MVLQCPVCYTFELDIISYQWYGTKVTKDQLKISKESRTLITTLECKNCNTRIEYDIPCKIYLKERNNV